MARLGSRTITINEMEPLLLEGHGLDLLLGLVQLKMAQQTCEAQGLAVTASDMQIERERTLDRLFAEVEQKTRDQIAEAKGAGQEDKAKQLREEMVAAREPLLDQFLQQQYAQTHNYMTRVEFDLLLTANAYLRKLAESLPAIQAPIPEASLREDFSAQYGEKAVVRHIQLTNTQEVLEAQRRLQQGQGFAQVAAAMSRNRQTGPLGGALPPFTRNSPEIPEKFREVAFSLKPGEVSDALQAGEAYHLIKLEQLQQPRTVKFEDVQPTLRNDRHERMIQVAVNQLREKLGGQARDQMRIEDPILEKKFAERLDAQKTKLRDREAMVKQMVRERGLTTQPTTGPADDATIRTLPAAAPSTQPAASRPPAPAAQ